jgi:DNA-directed RNA polymerase subunit RPC12/RpoP
MNYINELFFDESGPDNNYVCPRCKTEFDVVEDLEYIDEHRVCPSCLTDVMLQALI